MSGHGLFVNGLWKEGSGPEFSRQDPTEGRVVWQHPSAGEKDVGDAVGAARAAAGTWGRLTLEERIKFVDSFADAARGHRDELLQAICVETGKPRWEGMTEVDAIYRKVELSKDALQARKSTALATREGVTTATRYRPLGTVAVLGPFNLPAHLPNGQIVPALLAGNTVVFKPSEMTPGVGELYAGLWEEAGLPAGVFNLVQGGRETGAWLAGHAGVNGVYFTGSYAGAAAISKMNAGSPEKLLALEMGGNCPILATGVSDVNAAAYAIVLSAFITAGQRCSCARRLILLAGDEGDRILARVAEIAAKLVVGAYTVSPEPFMGPVISEAAGKQLLAAQEDLLKRGGASLLRMGAVGTRVNMLTPGIVDVTPIAERADDELFGPLLQVVRVADFDAAIAEANRTRYGLAAALLGGDRAMFDRFYSAVNAGVMNWNRPTTGAAGNVPFGGLGASGNHRPAGFFAVDFCCDPVASIEAPALEMPKKLLPGMSL